MTRDRQGAATSTVTGTEVEAAASSIDAYWARRCGEYLAKRTLVDMARAALEAAAAARPVPQAGEVAELVARLRSAGDREEGRPYSTMHEAADLLTAQDAALRETGRLALVISSAVRFACPDNLAAVLAALKTTRALLAPAGKEPEQP